MIQTKRILLSIKKFIKDKTGVEFMGTVFFCVLLLAGSIFSSCNGSARQSDKKRSDSTLIELPAPPVISPAELLQYKNACESWYDTVLKQRGFNGGIIVAKKG